MVGAKFIGSLNETEIIDSIAAEAIAVNDFVTLVGDGKVEATDAGDPIFGVAMQAATAEDQVIKVMRVKPGMKFLMDNDNLVTTFAVTHVGGRFDMTGNSGAHLVDTSTVDIAGDGTDHGQLFCIAYNPQGHGFDTDTSIGLYEVAEIQGLGYVTHVQQ